MAQSPERKRQYRKLYHAKHKDRLNARSRANGRTVRGRYSRCRSRAAERELEFSLTFDQYAVLISRPCYYCGSGLPEAGSGLDRRDNKRGYVSDNVVPCCRLCNTIKSNKLTDAEMRRVGAVLREIYSAREKDVAPLARVE